MSCHLHPYHLAKQCHVRRPQTLLLNGEATGGSPGSLQGKDNGRCSTGSKSGLTNPLTISYCTLSDGKLL